MTCANMVIAKVSLPRHRMPAIQEIDVTAVPFTLDTRTGTQNTVRTPTHSPGQGDEQDRKWDVFLGCDARSTAL